jgi:cell division protein FtsL
MRSVMTKISSFPLIFRLEPGRAFLGMELKKFLAYALFSVFFLGGLLFYLWPNMQLLQSGFQYNNLMTQKERLIEENRALRLEISSLESMERVERISLNELGMTAPAKGQIIYVRLVEADGQGH